MSPDYLRKYYDFERNHWWFQVREKIIVQQLKSYLPAKQRLKILNAGCATGRSSQMLSQFGEVVSVENDYETCRFLKKVLHIDAVNCDLVELPFEDESFDVVCVFDVIEHIEDERKAIAELSRVCKSGALLFCTVPAFSFLWSNHDEVNHHKRRYTQSKLRFAMADFFGVEYSTYFNTALFFPIVIFRLLFKRGRVSQSELSDFELGGFLNGSLPSRLFRTIFSLEISWLRYFKLPFGISILLRAKKLSSGFQNDKHL